MGSQDPPFRQINRGTEEGCQILAQAGEAGQGHSSVRCELGDQVYVAVRTGVAADDRSEDPEGRHPALLQSRGMRAQPAQDVGQGGRLPILFSEKAVEHIADEVLDRLPAASGKGLDAVAGLGGDPDREKCGRFHGGDRGFVHKPS